MTISLELRKIRRTGFFPALITGGLLSGMFALINTSARPESFTSLPGSPVRILLEANWQMMSMLNLLLLITGACILYHIEYSENAIQKMNTLPLMESGLFFSKAIVLLFTVLLILAVEGAALFVCGTGWFDTEAEILLTEILKSMGCSALLLLPALLLSLLISSVCRNMWTTLGIGVLCIFTASMLPSDSFILSLFPFAVPFQLTAGIETDLAVKYITAAISELLLISMAKLIIIKVRRFFK